MAAPANMKAPAKKKGTKKESTLYNLSRYIRVYLEEDSDEEDIRGIMISGYRFDENGEKMYCNIWIDKDFVIKDRPDGTYTLMLKMVEKEFKE